MLRIASLVVLLFGLGQTNQSSGIDPEYITPHAPFTIAGNLHFVGSKGLSSFLITTPQGHMLIDSGAEGTAPIILANRNSADWHRRRRSIHLSIRAACARLLIAGSRRI